jgi:hypothetical protein
MCRITLGRVHDNVVFRECGEEVRLHVSAEPGALVEAVKRCQPIMNKLSNNLTEENMSAMYPQIRESAIVFSTAIFGMKQAQKLSEFYNADMVAVLRACSQYFTMHLCRKITKLQKRRKHEIIRKTA